MAGVRLEPWGEDDGPVLARLLGDPAMMEHLGGPESPEKIAERQARYVDDETGVFRVVEEASGAAAGWVGYWAKTWDGEEVYEAGWSVLPEFQGRGIAVAATRLLLATAAREGDRRWIHAFPAAENAASNAVCRRAGFAFVAEVEFPYPPGHTMRCHDWRAALP